ncbi:MAG: GNAT family N-acetyltransferase [Azoarcus sp.]|nr:GNAT family N-acetyltransferase [Azoarcus sp.]
MNCETADCGLDRSWVVDDGTVLRIRPVRPEDITASLSFVRGLSFGARYFRFGRGDVQFGEAEVADLCCPDPCNHAGFIALAHGPDGEKEIATARYCIQSDGQSAEFAIVVGDAWQGRGVGRQLLEVLLDSARLRGLGEMLGDVLVTNRRMIGLAVCMGFELVPGACAAVQRVRRPLFPASQAGKISLGEPSQPGLAAR